MSVEEMKKEAIKKIGDLKDEAAIREILEHIEKLASSAHYSLSAHYDSIKQKYHTVLQKLAK